MSTTIEPTLPEKLHALEVTALRLTAERDVAREMASQETKDRVRERREYDARLMLRDNLIESLRISADAKDEKIRQLTAQLREAAPADEGRQQQGDVMQQQREAPAPWRRLLKRLGNRKDRP